MSKDIFINGDWVYAKHKGRDRFKPTTQLVLSANRKNITKANEKLKKIYGKKRPWVQQPDNSNYLKNCKKERKNLLINIKKLRGKGATLQQIGDILGFHRQRIWYLLKQKGE